MVTFCTNKKETLKKYAKIDYKKITMEKMFAETYGGLPMTRTLANSNLALTRTKIDFPWISNTHSL